MGLWRFVVAQGVEEQDATADTQAFLNRVQLKDLQDKETWRELTTLVQVIPDADIFPVRARYAQRIKAETKSADMPTIGVNYLSAEHAALVYPRRLRRLKAINRQGPDSRPGNSVCCEA